MSNQPAPVALFVYARPEHTRRTLEALKHNNQADKTDLIVFADSAKNENDLEKVEAVRKIVKNTTGFRNVEVIQREMNYCISKNITNGVSDVCEQYDRVIVLEDDLVTSPWFLTFMNEAMDYYQDEERVASIEGYIYPVKTKLPETFFLRGAGGWGWATWSHAWTTLNTDAEHLLEELKRQNLADRFDWYGAFPGTRYLELQADGLDDNWDVLWHASAFVSGKFTLHPGRSLVQNIGHDGTGVHGGRTHRFDVELSDTRVCVGDAPIEDSPVARAAFERFLRQREPLVSRVKKLLRIQAV